MKWPTFWSADSSQSESNDKSDSLLLPPTQSPPDTPVLGHDAPSPTTKRPKKWLSYLPSFPSSIESNSLFLTTSNIIPVILLTSTCLASFAFYRNYLRRIPAAGNISPGFFRNRSIVGRVTRVGDGDNFRLFHTPGGRLAGWGWLPGRKVPEGKELKDKTIHIRLAGVDAPELPHFGRPAQPYSQEALDWLTKYVLGRRVRAYVYKRDQYDRVVATAYVWRWLLRRDVGLQMLRTGLATVYEAKTGAEFGEGLEEKYRAAEKKAKKARRGMWAGKSKDFESPREYKTKYGSSEKL